MHFEWYDYVNLLNEKMFALFAITNTVYIEQIINLQQSSRSYIPLYSTNEHV